MKFHEWGVGVDPDESCWVESVKFNVSFLVVIRVFYELGPPACEEIGQSKYYLLRCTAFTIQTVNLVASFPTQNC
jgi:hypothetical protein